MNKRRTKAKAIAEESFEIFVQRMHQRVMEDQYIFFSNFGAEKERFEMGFLSALSWIGAMLRLNLTALTDEEKDAIDDVVNSAEQRRDSGSD